MSSLVLKKAKILGEEGPIDILIEEGKIKDIGFKFQAEKEIDVGSKLVLPGLIDSHVHFREPGSEQKEDWSTGSKAAAHGGITTVLDMPNNNPPCINQSSLNNKRKLAGKSLVNFGFHFGAALDNLEEIKKAEGAASIKIFMGSSTGNLLVDDDKILKNIFLESPKLLLLHAEDEEIIKKNTENYKNESSPAIHSKIRDRKAASSALNKAIVLAKETGATIYICHVSTKEEINLIKKAKAEGIKIYGEVSPHHLLMTEEEYKTQGNFVKMNPPLRTREDCEALWQGIEDGIIDTIGTDHAPHTKEEKEKDYWEAPSGVPGEETMLPLLLNEVNQGNLDLEKLVELTSFNPARIFRLENKGSIRKGYDADLTVCDLNFKKEVKNEDLSTKCSWSPFAGRKLKGWPMMTIVGGNIVYDSNKIDDNFKGREVKYEKL